MSSVAFRILRLALLVAVPAWGNVAPPEMICRARIVHSARRTIPTQWRETNQGRVWRRHDLHTPFGPVTFFKGTESAPAAEHDAAEVFNLHFEPDVDRSQNWILSCSDYEWFRPVNPNANCHAFAMASRLELSSDYWLEAEYLHQPLEYDQYDMLLRSFFVPVCEGKISGIQSVLNQSGARDGDVIVFGRIYQNRFTKDHSGLLFHHRNEWQLLHKIGQGPTVLTPLEHVSAHYGTIIRDFRVYRGIGESEPLGPH